MPSPLKPTDGSVRGARGYTRACARFPKRVKDTKGHAVFTSCPATQLTKKADETPGPVHAEVGLSINLSAFLDQPESKTQMSVSSHRSAGPRMCRGKIGSVWGGEVGKTSDQEMIQRVPRTSGGNRVRRRRRITVRGGNGSDGEMTEAAL